MKCFSCFDRYFTLLLWYIRFYGRNTEMDKIYGTNIWPYSFALPIHTSLHTDRSIGLHWVEESNKISNFKYGTHTHTHSHGMIFEWNWGCPYSHPRTLSTFIWAYKMTGECEFARLNKGICNNLRLSINIFSVTITIAIMTHAYHAVYTVFYVHSVNFFLYTVGSNKVIHIYSLIGQHFESKISHFYDDLLVHVNVLIHIYNVLKSISNLSHTHTNTYFTLETRACNTNSTRKYNLISVNKHRALDMHLN